MRKCKRGMGAEPHRKLRQSANGNPQAQGGGPTPDPINTKKK